MASSINASTSGAGGVITSADNSGILNLQSGGNTIATVQSTGFSLPTASTINAANTFGFKNRIINGGMTIDQRNAGASVTQGVAAEAFVVDRFAVYGSVVSKFTAQQNAGSVTPPVGFNYYVGMTSSSAYSVGATDYFYLYQKMEGFNVADLGFGTANAKTVTISAWVRSSLTGTFGGALTNAAVNRSYPFTYSIPTANTWTQISVTIAGDTGGTWVGATNAAAMTLYWNMGAGTNYSGTAGAWAAATYTSATGATSVVGTSGATLYITGVQLEVGSQATSFDFRDYGRELIMCQRYYYQIIGSQAVYYEGYGGSGTYNVWTGYFPTTMRTAPTCTLVGTYSYGGCSTVAVNTVFVGLVNIFVTGSAGPGRLYFNSQTGGGLTVSAEL
jgi:hypothetical protein